MTTSHIQQNQEKDAATFEITTLIGMIVYAVLALLPVRLT